MTGARSRWAAAAAVLAAGALLLGACSSSKSTNGGSAAADQSTTMPSGPLTVLVTNDDGYAAPGIDALVQALTAVPDTQVTVVAPATNQSGVGGRTTSGTLTATDVATASGYPAKAVDGTPADTITWAIDQHGIDFTPDVVISGVNFGQNVGSAVNISGTVGAARAAAARGIPALAASQSVPTPPDFPVGVAQVLDWLSMHRGGLLDGSDASPVLLENLNAPTCAAGSSARSLVNVPLATNEAPESDLVNPDCTSTLTDPPNDVIALNNGFITLSTLPLTPQ